VAKFVAHHRGHEYLLEQSWQELDLFDSKAQTLQALPLAVQFFQGIFLEYLVFLQKFVDLVPGFESKKPPQIGPSKTVSLELFSSQSFQRAPRQIATSPHPAGKVVGNVHDHVHDFTLARGTTAVN
jgi:hypothetical protein